MPANDGWAREAALAVAGRMRVAVQPGTRPVKPVCERGAVVREALEAGACVAKCGANSTRNSACGCDCDTGYRADGGVCKKLYTLTVTKTAGGDVSSSPAGIDCGTDCAEKYVDGTTAKLTAAPDANRKLSAWSGACSASASTTCAVLLDGDKTVGAAFVWEKRKLTVARPGNGYVAASGINCGSGGRTDCTEEYDHGTEVTLTATEDRGYDFASWGGDCSASAASSTCKLTMKEARTASASFAAECAAATVARCALDRADSGATASGACAAGYDGSCASLRAGALDGLAGLQMLDVYGQNVLLEPGSFRGLANLRYLFVLSNRLDGADALPPLRPGVFEGMPRLRHLRLIDGSRAAIEPGLFEGLAELNELFVGGGRLARLRAGMFRGLPNLRKLEVDMSTGSSPVAVEAGVFDGLANLEELRLNSLASVPPGVFADLSELRELALQRNAFASLEAGAFDGLSSLWILRLDNARHAHSRHRHELPTLPPGLFAGLPLGRLHLTDVGLRELRPGAFREVGGLSYLHLDNNRLAELAPETFDGALLAELDLGGNRLASLPAGLFEDQPRLQRVDLSHNRLAALPPGLFVGAGDWGLGMAVALHGNPGAPFRLALEPVVASAAWERPARVGVRVAEGAPFRLDVGLEAAGGRLEADVATIAHATPLSNAVAVSPAGAGPVVVRVAGIPEAPGADCADILDAGRPCGPPYPGNSGQHYTGIRLAAGRPLVLNGVAPRQEFDEPMEIDLSNVFLEFDGSDAATFAVRVSDPAVATAEIAGALLRVAPADHGTATVAVTATAADGRTATRTFAVAVPRQPRFLRGWRLWLLDDGGGGG